MSLTKRDTSMREEFKVPPGLRWSSIGHPDQGLTKIKNNKAGA